MYHFGVGDMEARDFLWLVGEVMRTYSLNVFSLKFSDIFTLLAHPVTDGRSHRGETIDESDTWRSDHILSFFKGSLDLDVE